MRTITILCLFFFAYTEARVCPDGAHKCPDWGTCCQNPDTSYGCCPYKNAECCSDFIHCCPLDTHCNVTNKSCHSSKSSSLTFQWMVPQYLPKSVSVAFDDPETSDTKIETSELKGAACPDGTPCKEESTCCPTGGDQFGCCLYHNADCCGDFVHCCPEGYNCDFANRQCIKKCNTNSTTDGNILPIFNLEKEIFESPLEKKCSPSNSCYLTGEICCSHGNDVFCCPKGSSCLPEDNGCKMDFSEEVSDYFIFKMSTNLEDVRKNLIVVCPDGKEYCPNNCTCCMTSPKKFDCCPMPEATCCPDHHTCCPNGYECVGDNVCEKK